MNEYSKAYFKENYKFIMSLIDKSLCKNNLQLFNTCRSGVFISTGAVSNVADRVISIKNSNPQLKIFIVTQSKNKHYFYTRIKDVQIICWDKPYDIELKEEVEKNISSEDIDVISYFSNVCIDLRNTNIVKMMNTIGNNNTIRCVIDGLTDVYCYSDIKKYIALLGLYSSFNDLLNCYKNEELV